MLWSRGPIFVAMSEEKEWFETWFDTDYYHTLYCHRNEQEAEHFIQNICDYLKLPENSKVLDFACGKGRHSYFLHQLGYDVLGVDLSSNSISHAKEMETEGLRFAVSDIRTVIEGEKFDAILNLFTSFGYFNCLDENLKVMNAIKSMLNDQGLFVIDFFNADHVLKNLITEETIERDHLQFQITKKHVDGQIIKTIEFEDNGKMHHYVEQVQSITLADFQNLCDKAGLKILHKFGSYDLHPFDPTTSKRLILIGSK